MWAKLMLALDRSGLRSEALRVASEVRRRLLDDLGAEPGPAISQLEENLRRQSATDDKPSIKRGNLPVRVSSFVGRNTEIAAVRNALGTSRLVTAVGPGGVGKTSVALEVARSVDQQIAEVVWFVELGDLNPNDDPALRLAAVLGVQEHPARPLVDEIAAALVSYRTLVVLDTCEHLLSEVSSLARRLLETCPQLAILATSRAPLGLVGERMVDVPPLDLPTRRSPAPLAKKASGMALFLDRARDVRADFELDVDNIDTVIALCHGLDGLPLAIELAASRLRSMTPDQLLHELNTSLDTLRTKGRDRADRHQTMRAAIRWSYDLLSDSQQRLARNLSIFPSSFTVDAALAVATNDDRDNAIELLDTLHDFSILTQTEPGSRRYHMLDTVREFLAEANTAAGDEPRVRQAQIDFYADWLGSDPDFDTADFQHHLEGVAAEEQNLHNALDWWLEQQDGEQAVRLIAVLQRHWFFTGQISRTLHYCQTALDLIPEATLSRAFLLRHIADILVAKGQTRNVDQILDEVESIFAEADETSATSMVAFARSNALEQRGDFAGSRQVLQREAERLRSEGHGDLPLFVVSIGLCALVLGDHDEVLRAIQELEQLAAGDRLLMAEADILELRGGLAHYRGDLETASDLLVRSLQKLGDLGRDTIKIEPTWHLAEISLAHGRPDQARELATELGDLARRAGYARGLVGAHLARARAANATSYPKTAGAELQEAANIVAATNDPYALMLTIETAAEITAASPSSRISLLSAAAAMRSELGVVLTAPRAAELSGHVQRLRAGVDADSFNEAWDSGATTNPVDFLDLVKAVATTPAEATRDADESDGR